MRTKNLFVVASFTAAAASIYACGNSTTTEPVVHVDAGGVDSGPTTVVDGGHTVVDAGHADAGSHDGGLSTDGGPTRDSGQVSDGGSSAITGMGAGVTFSSVDAVSGDVTNDAVFFGGNSTIIYITNFSNACTAATGNTIAANSADLFIQLAVNLQPDGAGGYDSTSSVTAAASQLPLTFTVNSDTPVTGSNAADGEVDSYDATCSMGKTFIVSGTVTVTAQGANGSLTGTLDVMTDDGGALSGSFTTEACSGVSNIADATCM